MPATLSNLMHGTVDWLRDHPAIGTLVFVAPIVIFIVSVWVAYRFMLAIPADYFAQKHKRLDPWRIRIRRCATRCWWSRTWWGPS